MKVKRKKFGFTLAEIMTVVTVLGIVSALVIPSTINRTTEKHTHVKILKIYSLLENALQESVIYNGTVTRWDIGNSNSYDGAKKAADNVLPFLNVAKHCGKASESEECFVKKYKSMKGSAESWITAYNSGSVRYTALLNDGSALSFWSNGNANCKDEGNCFAILVDINGPKSPNQAGVDTFEFTVFSDDGKNYVEPLSNKNHCTKTSTDYMNGHGCAGWLVKKGNLKYLRDEISEDT